MKLDRRKFLASLALVAALSPLSLRRKILVSEEQGIGLLERLDTEVQEHVERTGYAPGCIVGSAGLLAEYRRVLEDLYIPRWLSEPQHRYVEYRFEGVCLIESPFVEEGALLPYASNPILMGAGPL